MVVGSLVTHKSNPNDIILIGSDVSARLAVGTITQQQLATIMRSLAGFLVTLPDLAEHIDAFMTESFMPA